MKRILDFFSSRYAMIQKQIPTLKEQWRAAGNTEQEINKMISDKARGVLD